MNSPDARMSLYLLGELSEPERTAFEREFFADPQVFDRLVAVEHELVDDYVRHRLTPPLRQRFEQHYMADPSCRERVYFAEALAATLDATASARPMSTSHGAAPWTLVRSAWNAPALALRLSFAAVIALLIVGSLALVFETSRLRRELAQSRTATATGAQHERELQQALSTERTRVTELTGELDRVRTHTVPAPVDAPAAHPRLPIVSLFLAAGGARAPVAGPPATLVIPPGVRQVRIDVGLDATDYGGYGVSLKPIAKPQIVGRQHLRPQTTTSGPRVTVAVAADRLAAGDYVLTLTGERPNGEREDVATWLFRVERP